MSSFFLPTPMLTVEEDIQAFFIDSMKVRFCKVAANAWGADVVAMQNS